jgi:hypothetical protein
MRDSGACAVGVLDVVEGVDASAIESVFDFDPHPIAKATESANVPM